MMKRSIWRKGLTGLLTLGMVATGITMPATAAEATDAAAYDQTTLYQEGYDLDVELEEEGAVLFQNNGVLPLSEDVTVDLYGYFSYNIIHGGGGSGKGKWDADCLQEKEAFELAGLDVNDELWAWMGSSSGAGLVQESWVADSGGTLVNQNTYDLPEVPVETYRKSIDVASPSTNVAIVTVGRQGHEGAELPMSMEANNISTDKRKGSADRTYLDPTETELELLDYLKNEAGYETIILLIDSSNVMTIGEYMEYTDAILWIGGPGESGLVGVANVLLGRDSSGNQISPSGRTADTWMYDFYSYPVYYNNGNGTSYTNLTEGGMGAPKYNQYEEGIFVGYRWYETAYADQLVLEGANTDEDGNYITYDFYNDYDEIVMMPFGGGLSYTTFDWEVVESDVTLEAHGTNTVKVRVTNTGDWAGKDTVQIYVHAPYYEGSIDKAEVVLAGFAKTGNLKPGESGVVTITFETDDIASYDYLGYIAEERGTDYNGNPKWGGYVLEQGDYEIRIQSDAHTQKCDPIQVNVAENIIYTEEEDGIRSSDESEAYNKLNDLNAGDGSGTMTYMSRDTMAEDWDEITNLNVMGAGTRARQDQLGEVEEGFNPLTGTVETTVTSNVALGDAQAEYVNTAKQGETIATLSVPYQNTSKTITLHYGYQGATEFVGNTGLNYWGLSNNDESYQTVVAGIGSSTTNYTTSTRFVRNGDTISEDDEVTEDTDPETSYGWDEVPWDDARWDDFTDQISLTDLVTFQGQSWGGAFAGTSQISSSDGPGEAGTGGKEGNTWFCSEVVMASTWNPELVERVGQEYGKQCVRTGITSCYGPAMDTHRSPFGGRNFEYYSEDGLLSGIMCVAETAGIQSEGVGTFNKHFMLNDLDGGRSGQIDYCNEQALREIYIRAWEYSIKNEDAPMSGMMASLNRIGLSWAHRGVYIGILREEFGFHGLLISDGMDVESSTGSVKAAFSQIACLLWSKTVTASTSVEQDGYIFKDNNVSLDSINDYYAVYQLRETWKNRLWYDTHILCNADIFDMSYWESDNTEEEVIETEPLGQVSDITIDFSNIDEENAVYPIVSFTGVENAGRYLVDIYAADKDGNKQLTDLGYTTRLTIPASQADGYMMSATNFEALTPGYFVVEVTAISSSNYYTDGESVEAFIEWTGVEATQPVISATEADEGGITLTLENYDSYKAGTSVAISIYSDADCTQLVKEDTLTYTTSEFFGTINHNNTMSIEVKESADASDGDLVAGGTYYIVASFDPDIYVGNTSSEVVSVETTKAGTGAAADESGSGSGGAPGESAQEEGGDAAAQDGDSEGAQAQDAPSGDSEGEQAPQE